MKEDLPAGEERKQPSLMQYTADTDKVLEQCPGPLLKKAEEDCAGIPEKIEKADCIYDICALNDENQAQETMQFELMKIRVLHGQVEEVGEGRCLDQDGKTYQGFQANMNSEKFGCDQVLKHFAVLVKGVRGAESRGDSGCFILHDSHLTEPDGRGIVASAEGVGKCWKLM